VVIRQTGAQTPTYLNLREVQLFDASGALVKPVSPALSSVYSDGAATGNCFDGKLDTMCSSNLNAGDWSPFLEIPYPCPGGSTSLSKVQIFNRLDDCCRARLDTFTLDFVDAALRIDRPSYTFSGAKNESTVWANGGLICHCWHIIKPQIF
jgi:hypothetical protein